MKPILQVDIDETVVLNLDEWKEWYKDITNEELILDSYISINDSIIKHNLNPLDYWKQRDLYKDKVPQPDALRVLRKYKDDFDIVFVSNCISEHKDSKVQFIKKYFGDIPFVDTNHKEYIKSDIVIDDRAYYLRQVKEKYKDTECIQIKTSVNNYHDDFKYFNWNDIDIFLHEYLKYHK